MDEVRTRRITREQLASGWIELRGVTPIQHQYMVLRELPDGTYKVKDPEQLLELKGMKVWK